jgi:hypothetical protein
MACVEGTAAIRIDAHAALSSSCLLFRHGVPDASTTATMNPVAVAANLVVWKVPIRRL